MLQLEFGSELSAPVLDIQAAPVQHDANEHLPEAVRAMSRRVLVGLRHPEGLTAYPYYPEKTVATAAVHQALRLAAAPQVELVA